MLLYRLALIALATKELTARLLRGDLAAMAARLGHGASDPVPRIWLHAASNGELISARPVIDRLLDEGYALLLTVNTDSAAAAASAWNRPEILVRLAPLDLRSAIGRIHRRLNITAHITMESDLWPHRILACPGPVLVLGGRLTARSAKGWKRFETIALRVLRRIDYLSAQDRASLERFRDLGLRPEATGPVFDLKALYTPPESGPDPRLSAAFSRADTWLAASTHEGEEDIILAAHKAALAPRPDLRLILAPRHPKRAEEIAARIAALGLTLSRRSMGEAPGKAQVYLADTMGEMHLWYALAGVTFVAGSLTDRGGHTPYEPAAFGSAILHGPDTGNFRAAYARLHDADAAFEIADATALGHALIDLTAPEKQLTRGAAARQALAQDTDIDSLMRDVLATLTA